METLSDSERILANNIFSLLFNISLPKYTDIVNMVGNLEPKESHLPILSRMETFIKEELNSTHRLMESNEKPQLKTVLAHALYRNSGDLAWALMDTGLYLKAFARNLLNQEGMPSIQSMEDIQTIQKQFSLQDQFSLIGGADVLEKYPEYLDFQNKSFSWINLIGAPYHICNMAALLPHLGATSIQCGVISQMKNDGPAQGKLKIASDYQAALELPQVLEILKKHEKKNTNKGFSRRKLLGKLFGIRSS